ncbi:MAG: SAM-dependent methyltransferase [Actinomycetales bacterium]|nr:SAM-dependent methyltransferase [Actinomycetales bacterium]
MTQDASTSHPEERWESLVEEGWVPRGIDPTTPNVARMYDYYLDGKDHYPADREAAERVLARFPEMRDIALANREFHIQVVRLLAEAGIRQFLDIGSGLPTRRNVHEAAREVVSDARVVYVDNDPVVVRHAQALLPGEQGRTAVLEADLRDTDAILDHPSTRELIDFDQPMAVLMAAVLHFVPDSDDPHDLVSRYVSRMAPGSYLMVSHAGGDRMPDKGRQASREYDRASAQMIFRTRPEIERFFDGLEILDPGVVPVGTWRVSPEEHTEVVKRISLTGLVGVGRKP